jgi:hypothetical protein
MNLDAKWVPMKWPCGPLEIARRNKSQSIHADLKETLEAWGQPSTLELLNGTPINCLIVVCSHRPRRRCGAGDRFPISSHLCLLRARV